MTRAAAALALMLTSCQADVMDEHQGEVPITLTAMVCEGINTSGTTRAGTDVQQSFSSGATFTAEFTGSGVTVSSATYTADGQGGATTTTPPYFTLDATSTTVHACCPSKPSGTFSVASNQSIDANYKASDLMSATATIWRFAPTCALTFTHKMAKIIVNATIGSGISSISGVYIIGGSRTVNITDATTCTFGTTLTDAISASAPLTVYSGTYNTAGTPLQCAALIPPQTVTSADFLKITTNKGNVIYKLNSKTFASGESYTFNVTITAAAVGTTIPIAGWGDHGSFMQAIDLGLSVKWANMNVGATSETDYGMYFMWGDLAGHPGAKDGNDNATDGFSFAWANYKWGTSSSSLTKYTSSDGKTTLEAADDAATAYWGSGWRMPTQAEFNELLNNTTNAWTSDYNDTGVAGYTFKANGQTIFLPAAGCRGSTGVNYQGSYGYYWSSTLRSGSPNRAYYLFFDSGDASVYGSDRYYGYPVRPVQSN